MSQRTSKIRNLRVIKAIRGDELKIDLGRSFNGGELKAWIKRTPSSLTYRPFTFEDNRYLILSPEDTSDYFDENDILIEAIEGKWYFDVEFLRDGETNSKTIYTGTIYFSNDITGSQGVRVIPIDELNGYSVSIDILQSNLSGNGTIEEQVVEYINALNYEKTSNDNDIFINII